jgi:2-polyprenyl-3-methyl-5-hydroxy-6-metoxy-1,4-benzoquinol methylase
MSATSYRVIASALLVASMNRSRRWLTMWRPYHHIATTRQQWDAEFAVGRWSYLAGLAELARYSVIAGYCHCIKPAGCILDLACGEGVLRERLSPDKFSRYVGVDISLAAIQRASRRAPRDAQTAFVVADVSTFSPVVLSWDVIVFNECLYYFVDPLSVTRRYRAALAADGLIVVSMNVTAESRKIWKALDAAYPVLDEVTLKHVSWLPWIVKVYRP